MERLSLDRYMMEIAFATAKRSTCPRLSVGAVIVRNGKIVSTGYNGSPRRTDHCLDVGCHLVDGSCRRAAHAEANAIIFAQTNLEGATLYVTNEPCLACSILIINSGIQRVVYSSPYINVDPLSRQFFEQSGVVLNELHMPFL